jgi:hypothetical protein
MKKSKGGKSKKKRQKRSKKPPVPKQENLLKSFLKAFWKPFTFIASAVGLVVAIFALYPDISIYSGRSLNPKDPFNSSFIIKNDSYYPIYDLTGDFVVSKVEFGLGNTIANYRSDMDSIHVEKLNRKSTTPIIFKRSRHGLENSVYKADINILLSYKLPILSIKLSQTVPFSVEKTTTGKYLWFEKH